MRPPPLTPLAAAVLHVPVPERALVIGCGDGDAALLLAREFPAARVRGVDSAEAVRAASARVGLDPEGRVAFKAGGRRSLPYPDRLFDLVVQVDGPLAVPEIARVLRPGGHAILVRSRRPGRHSRRLEGLARKRLARRGIVATRTETAGDGNFTVARHDGRR